MASSKIVARVADITHAEGQSSNEAQFVVQYYCTGGGVGGGFVGEALLSADVTQNETQIKNDLSGLLAAVVNLIFPGQGFAANDIRGLNI